jgi:hypothetical protein
LGCVEETEVEQIQAAGQLMADCLAKDGIIHRLFSPSDITTLNNSRSNSLCHSREKCL